MATVRVFDEDRRKFVHYETIGEFTGPRATVTLLPEEGRHERRDPRFADAKKYGEMGPAKNKISQSAWS